MTATNNFQKPWHGIPREEIDWFPTVVAERCIGCGLCVTSCGRKVYGFDYEANVAVVDNPLNCMVGCSTCATVCPREAIEFPSRGYIQQLIRDKKLLRQTKDVLKENPELYASSRRVVSPGD
ncbi:MAG: ferredoxin family protein [Anaerolineae bacterium]